MRLILVILLVFILSSCSDDWAGDYRNDQNKINIYLVKQSSEFASREETDLNILDLDKTPWLKSSDIEFYDWSAHAFFLNKEVEKAKYSGRNFVVCEGNKRLFKGVFWPMYMSSFPSVPSILPDDEWFSPKDVILFNSFGWITSDVIVDDGPFKTALINADLFREGIEVELVALKKIDSSTLEYTFLVRNNDSGNIYVPDPFKMGTKRFYYFTNGVFFEKDSTYYSASGFDTEASDEIKDEWYYKLKPGESITRTLQLNGYSDIPTGLVKAFFMFPGAHFKGTGEWKKPDGRIWIGEYRAEAEIPVL